MDGLICMFWACCRISIHKKRPYICVFIGMDKRITGCVILFFFLFTLAYSETGWTKLACGWKKSAAADCTDNYPDGEEEDLPSDSEEEDTSRDRETDDREMGEY